MLRNGWGALERVLGSSLAEIIGHEGAAQVANYRERSANVYRPADLGVAAYQCGRQLRGIVHIPPTSGVTGDEDLRHASPGRAGAESTSFSHWNSRTTVGLSFRISFRLSPGFWVRNARVWMGS